MVSDLSMVRIPGPDAEGELEVILPMVGVDVEESERSASDTDEVDCLLTEVVVQAVCRGNDAESP